MKTAFAQVAACSQPAWRRSARLASRLSSASLPTNSAAFSSQAATAPQPAEVYKQFEKRLEETRKQSLLGGGEKRIEKQVRL